MNKDKSKEEKCCWAVLNHNVKTIEVIADCDVPFTFETTIAPNGRSTATKVNVTETLNKEKCIGSDVPSASLPNLLVDNAEIHVHGSAHEEHSKLCDASKESCEVQDIYHKRHFVSLPDVKTVERSLVVSASDTDGSPTPAQTIAGEYPVLDIQGNIGAEVVVKTEPYKEDSFEDIEPVNYVQITFGENLDQPFNAMANEYLHKADPSRTTTRVPLLRSSNHTKMGGLYWCQQCSFSTPNKRTFNRHCSAKHKHNDSLNIRQCSQCLFSTQDPAVFESHQAKHTDLLQFQCLKCYFRTADREQLDEHVAGHEKNTSRKCPTCEYVATNNIQLQAHVRLHSEKNAIKCSYCSYLTNVRRSLMIHMKRHTGSGLYACSLCSFKTIYSNCLQSHMKQHLKETWLKCEYCSFETPRKADMTLHVSKHTMQNMLTCSLCAFMTPYKQNMEYHVSIHTKTGFIKCTFCQYSTLKKSYMDCHIRAKHTREGLFECKFCDFKSAYKHHLRNHSARHYKQGQLLCSVCQTYTTSRDDELLNHLKQEHNSVRNFECSQCTLVTKSKAVLVRHLRRHKGEKTVSCMFKSDRKRDYLRYKNPSTAQTVNLTVRDDYFTSATENTDCVGDETDECQAHRFVNVAK